MFHIVSVSSRSAKIAAGAVVCVESEIRGDVTIGESLLLPHREARCLSISCVLQ